MGLVVARALAKLRAQGRLGWLMSFVRLFNGLLNANIKENVCSTS